MYFLLGLYLIIEGISMKQKRLNFVYDEESDLFIENNRRLYVQNDNNNRNNNP